jgi:protein-S-isoprenylcysteine O-methyltransferase Ste14
VLKYQVSLGGKPFLPFLKPWTILQTCLVVFSVSIIFFSFISYGPLEFLGIAQIINRDKGAETCTVNISTKGLLGIVRHPMYLAVMILVWTFNETPIDMLFNVIMTIYFIIGTHLEERKLISCYGREYEEYKKKVPMFIPFWYKIKRPA